MRKPLWVVTTSAVALFVGFIPASATVNTVDDVGSDGIYNFMRLDAQGNPVISYYEDTEPWSLKVAHCNDPVCSPGGDSITTPSSGGLGTDSWIVLDAAGNPVISYHDKREVDLRLLHCNDPNCAPGGDTDVAPDSAGEVGWDTSLALDSNGFPIIAYHQLDDGDLRVMHCNDPNCVGGDESIQIPDSEGDTGEQSYLLLDDRGNPIVMYMRVDEGQLKLLHCDDPSCAPGGDSVVVVDDGEELGHSPSMELDEFGNPVASYHDLANEDLKVVHCNDPNCSPGGDSIVTVDEGGNVGWYSSLELSGNGLPVIAYNDFTNGDLKLMRCNDPSCAGHDEDVRAVVTEGDTGRYPWLALDSVGRAVVAFRDETNHSVRLYRDDVVPPVVAPVLCPGPRPTTANCRLVVAGYEDFLARTPTAAELFLNANLIDGGLQRYLFFAYLASSEEWIGRTVDRMFVDTLGRPADAAGRAYWIAEIRSGRRTVAAVAALLYGSSEYYTQFGGNDPGVWVEDLYRKLLGRPPEAAGRSYWAQLAITRGRPEVALDFYQSAESRARRVDGLYASLLSRPVDAGGQTFWSQRILTKGDLALAVDLASSPEYSARAQTRDLGLPSP